MAYSRSEPMQRWLMAGPLLNYYLILEETAAAVAER